MFQYISLPADSPYLPAISRINGLLAVASFLKYQSAHRGIEFYQSSLHQIPWKGDLLNSVKEQAGKFHQEITKENSCYENYYKKMERWPDEITLQRKGADYFVKNLPLELFHEANFPPSFTKGGKGRNNHLDAEPFTVTDLGDAKLRARQWLTEVCRLVWQQIKTELIRGRDYNIYVSLSPLTFCDACDLGGETLIHCGEDIFVFYNGVGD